MYDNDYVYSDDYIDSDSEDREVVEVKDGKQEVDEVDHRVELASSEETNGRVIFEKFHLCCRPEVKRALAICPANNMLEVSEPVELPGSELAERQVIFNFSLINRKETAIVLLGEGTQFEVPVDQLFDKPVETGPNRIIIEAEDARIVYVYVPDSLQEDLGLPRIILLERATDGEFRADVTLRVDDDTDPALYDDFTVFVHVDSWIIDAATTLAPSTNTNTCE